MSFHLFYFIFSHQTKSTHWAHPRTNKIKKVSGNLPLGWEKQVEESTGKIIFIDHNNERTTYTDPRLAFAVEEIPQNISEVRQRFDASSTALQVLHGRDLSGKIAVITGCNTGIGFETARSMALHGCQIIMACRNEESSKVAIDKIMKEKPTIDRKPKYIHIDLERLESVDKFVQELKSEIR